MNEGSLSTPYNGKETPTSLAQKQTIPEDFVGDYRGVCVNTNLLDQSYKELLLSNVESIVNTLKQKGDKPIHKRLSTEGCKEFFTKAFSDNESNIKTVLIHGRYIFCYVCTTLWYTDQYVLAEQFMLRLSDELATGDGNPFPVIEKMAEMEGADLIVLSDALGVGDTLGRLYKRAGYNHMASEYVKEVSWE